MSAGAACIGALVLDLLAGIGVAVGLSVAELFARIGRAHDAGRGEVSGLAGLHDVDDDPRSDHQARPRRTHRR